MSKNWGFGYLLLQGFECFVGKIDSFEISLLFGHSSQGLGELEECFDETSIEIAKIHKRLYFFNAGWAGSVDDILNLFEIHT